MEKDVVATSGTAYAVIVPVCNEAPVLPVTVPALLRAVEGEDARIIYVCNGCRDDSAAIIRRLAGRKMHLVERDAPGKTAALNAGDRAAAGLFPRFYLDADVTVAPGGFRRLAEVLRAGDADLVAPGIAMDVSRATPAARAIAETWQGLPHAREAAFHHLLGLSAAGRAAWGELPEILGDDIFIAAAIPRARRKVVWEVTATTWCPSSFPAWIGVRARWLRGERELARMGRRVPRAAGQGTALLRRLGRPRTAGPAAAYALARLLAEPVSRLAEFRGTGWFSDRAPGVQR